MKIYEVLIEYTASSLDRPFSYAYFGDKDIAILSRVIVPFNNKEVCGFVCNINNFDGDENLYKEKTGFELKEIISVIDEKPIFNDEMNQLAKMVAKYYFSPLISVYFAMLPPSLKPSMSSQNKPSIAYDVYLKAVVGADYENLTTKQAELLFRIIDKGEIKKSECSPCLVEALLKKGKITTYRAEKNRLKLEQVKKVIPPVLNEEQMNAFNEITNGNDDVYLLEGVTGSGKTEVYMACAETVIKRGKNVLFLVPEISLSYMMVERFKSRFEKVAILHSNLTPAQRYDEYRHIRDGEVNIVIGARSAIFAPLNNVGLIIIDEEHSETYKQEDSMPYYHALEVAKIRQKLSPLKIVLGSATPSLESKSRALKGVYKQLYLHNRINDLKLPEVKIIDMAQPYNIDRVSNIISLPLRKSIENRLEKNEQTILLVNRRGFSPYVSCRKCGYVFKCPECQVSLTYHKEENKLICHHCGYEKILEKECPKCHSDKVFKSGFGSEKVEDEVKKLFPLARVLRLDSDTMKKRTSSKTILEQFKNKQADILIGTQVVAKGHDFDDVTLVGIVLADIGLSLPSFKAGETTFSLITQAIGRSGRSRPGEALIQTYQPQNFIIKTASKQDYMSFYIKEIQLRKLLQNPPYTYLTLLIVSGLKEEDVIEAIYEVKKYLMMKLEHENVSLIGPSELFIKKYQNKYRRKLLIKYKNFEVIKPYLEDIRIFFSRKGSLTLTINVDPFEDY